ncbi:MAG TPA: phage Gp37/Gp68 family protein [Chloroflexota bacterium]|nr:phage Gp37/Gp68 family protein [Chloroflexota bacterium]
MSDNSAIEWTNATWNPVTGCSKVSEGCRNCYAEALSLRFGRSKKPWAAQFAAENVVPHPERLMQPLRWRDSRMIFVNSMSDLFHERVTDDFIGQIFDVMARASHHTFQVLTKRPKRMLDWQHRHPQTPLPNVWLGVSVENQDAADERIPLLMQVQAAVRFLSCEPLLGPVDLTDVRPSEIEHYDILRGRLYGVGRLAEPQTTYPRVDWVIVGGESGPRHRPMDLNWARDLRDQCLEADVPFFFKQVGGRTPKAGGRELDEQIWDQFPTEPLEEAVAASR